MKTSGDISVEEKAFIEAVEAEEKIVDADTVLPPERKAQGYACLAYEWYHLEMEEEGNRLLLKAEKVCPGYFKGPVIEQQKENPNFDIVIKAITLKLLKLMGTASK